MSTNDSYFTPGGDNNYYSNKVSNVAIEVYPKSWGTPILLFLGLGKNFVSTIEGLDIFSSRPLVAKAHLNQPESIRILRHLSQMGSWNRINIGPNTSVINIDKYAYPNIRNTEISPELDTLFESFTEFCAQTFKNIRTLPEDESFEFWGDFLRSRILVFIAIIPTVSIFPFMILQGTELLVPFWKDVLGIALGYLHIPLFIILAIIFNWAFYLLIAKRSPEKLHSLYLVLILFIFHFGSYSFLRFYNSTDNQGQRYEIRATIHHLEGHIDKRNRFWCTAVIKNRDPRWQWNGMYIAKNEIIVDEAVCRSRGVYGDHGLLVAPLEIVLRFHSGRLGVPWYDLAEKDSREVF